MANKLIVVLLTQRMVLENTLPYAETRHVIFCGYAVSHLTLSDLRLRMENVLLNIGRELQLSDRVFIVMEPTAREFAAAWMLTTALQMLSIEPEIWVMEDAGMYVGIKEFLVTGQNWAREMLEAWRQKAAEEQFKEVMLTEEEKSVLKKSE